MRQDIPLTSEEVREVTLETLSEVVDLKVEGDVYPKQDILHTLVAAAADRTTLEQACGELAKGGHSNTVRHRLHGLQGEEGETQLNAGLVGAIPLKLDGKGWKVAMDLTLHPYSGKVTDPLRDVVIRSAAKAGTTRFFGYATGYGSKKNQRYTLGLHLLRQDESLGHGLRGLLDRVKALGVRIQRLYLERGFSASAGSHYLQAQRIPALMPGVKQGKKGGIRTLVVGRKSSRTPYTLRTQKPKEEATIDVAIGCTSQKGKRGKRGCRLFGYAFFNYTPALSGLHDDSRPRFGIETSYRVGNQARGWTTSREPVLRLMFFGIALILQNIWVRLKWCRGSLPRRGGRLVREKIFPFRRMLRLLLQAIQRGYGVTTSLALCPPGEKLPTYSTL